MSRRGSGGLRCGRWAPARAAPRLAHPGGTLPRSTRPRVASRALPPLALALALAPVTARAADAAPPRPLGRFRIDLGLSFATLGGLSGGVAGPLAVVPTLAAAAEVRLAGPAWLFVRGGGSYANQTLGPDRSDAWTARLALGARVEPRVNRWLDVGGHVLVEGSATGLWAFDASQGGDASLGLAAGPSFHFHPTAVFGTRLSLDVVRGLHQWVGVQGQPSVAETTSLDFTPAPRVELTFTF